MAENIVTFIDGAGATQEIAFDATPSHAHEFSQTVTDSSVEEGVNVSDHATPDLDRVVLNVFVSNQPIRAGADPSGRIEEIEAIIPKYEEFSPPVGISNVDQTSAGISLGALTQTISNGISDLLSRGGTQKFRVLLFDQGLNRPRQFYETFKALSREATLCRVLTSLHDYDNMVVLNVSAIRSTTTGDGAEFDISFREIRIVATEVGVVAVDVAVIRAAQAQSLGSKASSDASAGNKSILAAGADAL